MRLCEQQYQRWPWGRMAIDYEQLGQAAALFSHRRAPVNDVPSVWPPGPLWPVGWTAGAAAGTGSGSTGRLGFLCSRLAGDDCTQRGHRTARHRSVLTSTAPTPLRSSLFPAGRRQPRITRTSNVTTPIALTSTTSTPHRGSLFLAGRRPRLTMRTLSVMTPIVLILTACNR